MKEHCSNICQQIEQASISASGIKIQIKNGNASNVLEMINFAAAASENNVSHYVKELFYNSNIGVCGIDVKAVVEPEDPAGREIAKIAEKHLSHFMLFGLQK